MKQFLYHCINLIMALLLLAGAGAYVVINSLLITGIINDLRLDTYVSLETGGSIVFLILLLGWGPVWLTRSLDNRR
jgi:hypothetical protein